jgi:hypothetical protein
MSESSDANEARYVDQAVALASNDADLDRARRAVVLFAAGLAMVPRLEWRDVFPNDFSAVACLARAHRQLRAALLLMMWGYSAEVRPILRFAYEACGLARMLAHEPARAEKWLRKMQWFPDREVRQWFASLSGNATGQTPAEILSTYRSGYNAMSARSHPTAIACMSSMRIEEIGPELQLESVFVEEEFRSCAAEIAATALFACFTLRNAAVDERAIDPNWRRDLYDLARDVQAKEMPHLERDWAEEQRRYAELQQRVQSAAHLRERLRDDPRSWTNLREPSA